MYRLTTLCAFAVALIANPTPAAAAGTRYLDEVFADVAKTSNVVYDTATNYNGNSIDLKLDLYEPVTDTEALRPVIVYIHGGYFASGDKSEGDGFARQAAKRGYVAATVNYRVWPGASSDLAKLAWGMSKAQWDSQSAIRYLRRNADTLRINPTAIFAAGYSAGAITSLNVNYRSFEQGDGANRGYASDVAGAVSMAGFANEVTPNSPPILMFHGTADPVVRYDWGVATCNLADSMGNSCVMHSYPGDDHDLTDHFDEMLPLIWGFFYGLLDDLLPLPAPLAGFHAISPQRLLDTRQTAASETAAHQSPPGGEPGAVAAGSPVQLDATGQAGVPEAGVSAVVVNVTAVGASRPMHVTIWPGDAPVPPTSSLNLTTGQTAANLVTTAVGPDGTIQLTNNTGTVDLVVDIVGWFDDGAVPGDRFNSIVPTRLLDTRDGTGGVFGRVPAGLEVAFGVGGTSDIPPDATAAMVNLTADGATHESHITAWPAGEAMPGSSNLNFKPGETVPNLAALKLGDLGRVALANDSGGVYAIADATGYYGATGNRFVAVTATRVLDTRFGVGAPVGRVFGGTTIDVAIKNQPGLPPDGIAGVVVNVTAEGATSSTHVTVFPTGSSTPNSSNLNPRAGQTIANLVAVGVGPGGNISLRNNEGGVHLLADVVGYYT